MRAWVVLTTAPDAKTAKALSVLLVRNRMAACVSLLPGVCSVYRWNQKIENSKEILLLIKTSASVWPKLSRFIQRHHPYDTPEILALPTASVSKKYGQWMQKCLR